MPDGRVLLPGNSGPKPSPTPDARVDPRPIGRFANAGASSTDRAGQAPAFAQTPITYRPRAGPKRCPARLARASLQRRHDCRPPRGGGLSTATPGRTIRLCQRSREGADVTVHFGELGCDPLDNGCQQLRPIRDRHGEFVCQRRQDAASPLPEFRKVSTAPALLPQEREDVPVDGGSDRFENIERSRFGIDRDRVLALSLCAPTISIWRPAAHAGSGHLHGTLPHRRLWPMCELGRMRV